MGEVFRAHDPVLNRAVAVKRISAGLDADEMVRKRFQREAQSAALLSHPNIITVYELGIEGDQLFMAMELLDGVDLKHAISCAPDDPRREDRRGAADLRGPGLRPRPRHRPPRPQAGQHPHPARRQGQDHGLRAGPPERLGDDDDRNGDGDPALHVPRAGQGPEGGRALRHLRARVRLLRAPVRPQAVRRRVDARGALQDHAGGAHSRARGRAGDARGPGPHRGEGAREEPGRAVPERRRPAGRAAPGPQRVTGGPWPGAGHRPRARPRGRAAGSATRGR